MAAQLENDNDLKESSVSNIAENKTQNAHVEKSNTRHYAMYSYDIDRFTLLSTDLPEEHEIELRTCISQKVNRSSTSGATGSIITLHLSFVDDEAGENAMCYFNKFKMIDRGCSLDSNLFEDLRTPDKHYILCFIGHKQENLDLFHREFDDFCCGLQAQYDGQNFNEDYLRTWYKMSAEYLCLIITTFQYTLKHLLYLALMGYKFTISGASPSILQAITQFIAICGLSEILQSDSHEENCALESSSLVDLSSDALSPDTQDPLVVTVTEDAIIVDDKYVSQFCDDWCSALIDKVANGPVCLKQIINSYKLKCIHDINELNRLIRLAENDHYALYRTYTFLKGCLNARVLLLYANQETRITKSTESQNILRVLEDYMAQSANTEP